MFRKTATYSREKYCTIEINLEQNEVIMLYNVR